MKIRVRDLVRRTVGKVTDFTVDNAGRDGTGMTKIYEPGFTPSGGWSTWESWAAEQGKIAAILDGRASVIMSYHLRAKPEYPDLQSALLNWQKLCKFLQVWHEAVENYETHGYSVVEPVFAPQLDGTPAPKECRLAIKLRNLHPPSVKTYRNTEADIRSMGQELAMTEWAEIASRFTPGDGDTIIGHVQTGDTNRKIYFSPDELIVIFRKRSARNPDGLSLLKQSYTPIMRKLKADRDQAIMASRHGDPKHVFHIPRRDWDGVSIDGTELSPRAQWKRLFSRGITSGMDFMLPSGEGEDEAKISIVEPSGNAVAVNKAHDNFDAMLMESMGYADSFMQSDSSNKSVGDIQLEFFERSIAPIRRIFGDEIERTLIDPMLRWYGFKPGDAYLEFEDITPDDTLRKAEIVSALIPYAPPSTQAQWFQNLGYDLPEGLQYGMIGFSKDHAKKGVPKAVAKASTETKAALKKTIEEIAEDINAIL